MALTDTPLTVENTTYFVSKGISNAVIEMMQPFLVTAKPADKVSREEMDANVGAAQKLQISAEEALAEFLEVTGESGDLLTELKAKKATIEALEITNHALRDQKDDLKKELEKLGKKLDKLEK